jgi:hypothetical protein
MLIYAIFANVFLIIIVMKRFLFILLICTLVSCEQEKAFYLDPTTMLKIKGEKKALNVGSQRISENPEHLTPLEIVKRATNVRCYNAALNATTGLGAAIGFAGKDTISEEPALLRYATDILHPDGYFIPDFLEAYDMVIEVFRTNNDIDTIAYIPNSVLREAEQKIRQAFDAQDYDEVYNLFYNAFKFRPITGAEYRELKAQGLQ